MLTISSFASSYGLNEAAFRLMISLILSYPICFFYNTFIMTRCSTSMRHFYYLYSGLMLMIFNYNLDFYHSLIACITCYASLNLIGGRLSLAINFTFTLIYLLWGCFVTQIGSDYSIKWTTPQCLLTLKLIAISFDINDGIKSLVSQNQVEKIQCVLMHQMTCWIKATQDLIQIIFVNNYIKHEK